MKNFEIGIDLGTTNSEVAVMQNGNVEIIANAFGDFYTPSVVGINKAHNIVVGKRAFEALNRFASSDELLNNKAEIKRLMGTATAIKFSRTNKTYLPEEISAEILKSLRADVLSKLMSCCCKNLLLQPFHMALIKILMKSGWCMTLVVELLTSP